MSFNLNIYLHKEILTNSENSNKQQTFNIFHNNNTNIPLYTSTKHNHQQVIQHSPH